MIVIACSKLWDEELINKLKLKCSDQEFILIDKKSQLAYDYLSSLAPEYIFFPHWSYLIPENIYKNFKCVIFHMTDLPFGRGGSPLQNLISREIYHTKISAIECVKALDAGDIYLKRDLSLEHGSAEDIFVKATQIIIEMICEMIKEKIIPKPQVGEPVCFARRKPEDSDLNSESIQTLEKVYDYIRMLDAKGYPKAYFKTDSLIYEFANAKPVQNGVLEATVKITKRECDNNV